MYSLLLVDDESFVINGLKQLLLELPYDLKIATADNGGAALEQMKKEPFDILFTDIKMPILDGISLIQEVNNLKIRCKIIILSGYADFSYAQQAIKNNVSFYLLKPIIKKEFNDLISKLVKRIDEERLQISYVNRIQMQVEQNRSATYEKFFQDLSHGIFHSDYADILNIQSCNRTFQLILLEGDNKIKRQLTSNNCNKLQTIIMDFLNTSLSTSNKFYCFSLNNEYGVLFSLSKRGTLPFLQEILKNLQKVILANLDFSVSIGISTPFDSLNEFEKCLKQAKEALSQKLFIGKQSLYFYSSKDRTQANYTYIDTRNLKTNLYYLLETGQKEEMEKLIAKTKSDFLKRTNCPISTIRSGILELLGLFTTYAFEHCISERALLINNQPPSSILTQCETIIEMFNVILDVYYSIYRELFNTSNNAPENIIAKIQSYIWEHINEEISLTKIAYEVNLTPNYISSSFKKKTGTSFKNYVVKAKMKYAKKLLGEGQLKVYEVAEAVGYHNIPYFSKLFKGIYHVYPSEYKRQI